MNKQSKILGLDLGDRHIGVALLDPQAPVALPLPALQNNRSFLPRLKALIATHAATSIVVGLPLTLAGTQSPQTHKVRQLAAKIEEATNLSVQFQDERFTSRQAGTMLNGVANLPSHHSDSVAAQLILQAWWEGQNR